MSGPEALSSLTPLVPVVSVPVRTVGECKHMVVYLATRVIHWFLSAAVDPNVDPVSGAVLTKVAGPILTSAQFLIPAAVAISGLHKMMEHRESGGSFLVDMVTKGGGAILVLQLVKAISGVG